MTDQRLDLKIVADKMIDDQEGLDYFIRQLRESLVESTEDGFIQVTLVIYYPHKG